MKQWNIGKRVFEPCVLPEGMRCPVWDLPNATINCTLCGEEIKFSESTPSFTVLTDDDQYGYPICQDCAEWEYAMMSSAHNLKPPEKYNKKGKKKRK